MERRVLTIEPKEKSVHQLNCKKRVAAYIRVSTESTEQAASFENQTIYYQNFIRSNPEWDFAGVYADFGTTGTSRTKRVQFNKMIHDCETGKIDLILTKSISRVCRNITDCLEVVRHLKSINVGVKFEKEGLDTLSGESELMLSVLSSLAEEESKSISKNVKWSYQKRFMDGKICINTKRFLGYDFENGALKINNDEAVIVKMIFEEYLNGKSIRQIKGILEKEKYKTVTGLLTWAEASIRDVLKNEKYCGDCILQKTYTPDNFKKKRNKGEVPMFHIENSHEAIVSKDDFNKVQRMISERALKYGNTPDNRGNYSKKYPFSGKIICGNCGEKFKRRMWNINSKSKQIVWQCSTYIGKGKNACNMKAMDEITLKAIFVRAFNKFYKKKDTIIKSVAENIKKVLSSGTEKQDIEIRIVSNKIKELIRKQIKGEIGLEEFNGQYTSLQKVLKELKEQIREREEEMCLGEESKARMYKIKKMLDGISETIEEFDDEVFGALVEKVLIISPTHVQFILKNGIQLEEKFKKKKGINGLEG